MGDSANVGGGTIEVDLGEGSDVIEIGPNLDRGAQGSAIIDLGDDEVPDAVVFEGAFGPSSVTGAPLAVRVMNFDTENDLMYYDDTGVQSISVYPSASAEGEWEVILRYPDYSTSIVTVDTISGAEFTTDNMLPIFSEP